MNNEPVAWMWSEDSCNLGVVLDQDKQIGKKEFQDYDIPLYTHPAKTLADEEIHKAEYEFMYWNRSLKEPLVKLASELYVFEQAVAILRKAHEK